MQEMPIEKIDAMMDELKELQEMEQVATIENGFLSHTLP
jgi:hypothetical protein